MKMDKAPDLAMIAPEAHTPQPVVRSLPSGFRFTSNIVGTLSMLADIVCFVISAPIALFLYPVIRGTEVVFTVHFFAFVLTLGSFLLIRSSRNAYRRSLVDL